MFPAHERRPGLVSVRRALALIARCSFVALPACTPTPPVGPIAPLPAPGTTWPGPSNAGVPAGTTLTVTNGGVTVDQAGAVLDARDIRGGVTVNAPNVTIRRSKISASIRSNSTGLMIVDVEMGTSSGTAGDIAVLEGGYTCLRCNIHNYTDGLRTGGGDVVVQDSWIHDLSIKPGDHNDGVQRWAPGKWSNDTIRHNTITCVGCTTSAIFYADDWRGELILDNNKLSGGGYTLRIHESGRAWVTNNRIVRGSYTYGPTSNTYSNLVQWAGNVFDDNSEVINPF